MRRGLGVLLLAAGSFPPAARATTLIVPDQAPTIQAALDAAVDTILIRPGAYPETLQVGGGVIMLGVSGTADRPRIAGLNVYDDYWGKPLIFENLQFDATVTVFSYPSSIPLHLVDCDLRGGITDLRSLGSIYSLTASRCFLGGSLSLPLARSVVIDSCQLLGSISAPAEDHVMRVRGCTLQGGGILSGHYQSTCVIDGNTLQSGGIVARGRDVVVTNNRIEGGSLQAGDEGAVTVTNNVIRGSEGGLYARGDGLVIANNLVEDCGYGIIADLGMVTVKDNAIRRSGAGIRVRNCLEAVVEGNVVTQSRAEGVLVERAPRVNVSGNVAWMCAADGIKIGSTPATRDQVTVRNNTSCYNGLSGFASDSNALEQEWVGNIGYANQEYGINWMRAGPATIACNDWFANRKGAVKGRSPSSEDLFEDPQFCDAMGGDVHLSSTSPLLEAPGCGQVGALGVGCASTVKGRAKARPRSALAEVTPNPGSGPMRIAFALDHAGTIEIDVFDLLGRRIASPARGEWPAGTHEVEWNGLTRNGKPAPYGVYMIRYAHPGGRDQRRIVRVP